MNYWFWGAAGLLAGASLGVRNMVKNGCPFPISVFAATGAIYGGLLGARCLYILIYYPELFTEDPLLAVAFWQSTGTWLGGPPAGLLGAAVVLKLAKQSFWDNAGSFVPGLVLAHMICRVGCIVNGCCYGSPTTVSWAAHSEVLGCLVHPTALYSILCELMVFIILQRLWRKPSTRPFLFPAYGMMLSFHRFFTEMFRGSDSAAWIIPGLRTFQTVSVFIFIISLTIFLTLKWKKKGAFVSGITLLVAFTVIFFLRLHDEQSFRALQGDNGTILVITRVSLEDGLDQWIAAREKQGFRIMVNGWDERPEPLEITAWVRRFRGGVSSILIAGDCAADPERGAAWDIPSIQGENSFGPFVSDSLYGDLDGDGVPDLPVGRLPARNYRQLRTLAGRGLKYESVRYESARLGESRHNVVVWAAAKPFYDSAVETVERVRNSFDGELSVRLVGPGTAGDKAPETFMALLERSPDLSIIAAHGSFRSVVSGSRPVSDPEQSGVNCLTVEDVLNFQAPFPSGPLFLLSCDSGRFNLRQTQGLSLAEAFLEAPGGPVCTIAASGTMAPAVNHRIAGTLADQMNRMPATAGELLLQIQKAALLNKGIGSEDIWMYNLIGDPTVALRGASRRALRGASGGPPGGAALFIKSG